MRHVVSSLRAWHRNKGNVPCKVHCALSSPNGRAAFWSRRVIVATATQLGRDGLAYHLIVCLILIAAQESGTLHPAVALITNAQTIDSIWQMHH